MSKRMIKNIVAVIMILGLAYMVFQGTSVPRIEGPNKYGYYGTDRNGHEAARTVNSLRKRGGGNSNTYQERQRQFQRDWNAKNDAYKATHGGRPAPIGYFDN
ncbi:MAG: hypothetical protein AAFO96_03900 [Bacteroidota bacterium]